MTETSISNTIEFVYTLKDNVSATASQMSQSTAKAQVGVDSLTDAQVKLGNTAETTRQAIENNVIVSKDASNEIKMTEAMSQQAVDSTLIRLTAQLAVIGSLKGAVNGLGNGLSTLGLISDDTADQIRQVGAAFEVMGSAAAILTSIQGLMKLVNAQQAISNALKAFSNTLDNPAMLIGVGVAGATAGAVGAMYLTNNNSQSTTNINVTDTHQAQATQMYDMINGGAL